MWLDSLRKLLGLQPRSPRIRKDRAARRRRGVRLDFERLEDRITPVVTDIKLDFIASAPQTYDHLVGGGAYDDRTINIDVVESLEGGDFACGELVSFLLAVDARASSITGSNVLELDFSFTADATGNDNDGVGFVDIVNVLVNRGAIRFDLGGNGTLDNIGDGPGATDSGLIDDGGSVATLVPGSEQIINAPALTDRSELIGKVRLTDVEAGEQIIIRIDVRIECDDDPTTTPHGNLQGAITDAFVVTPTEKIPVGNQTIPLKVNDIQDLRGSISWEKRREDNNALQGGATFTVTNNATGAVLLTVTDNGLNDVDDDAGQITVTHIPPGTYTVTETVAPPGYALDDDPTRVVTVSSQELDVVIGTQDQDDPGNTDESDFHNRLGSISWEKRREDNKYLQGGATFTVTNNATGTVIRTVTDNQAGDSDPDPGQITVTGIPLGTYTVREIAAPPGFILDDDPTRVVTVSVQELNPVIGTQNQDDPGNTDESDFHNPKDPTISWEKRREDNGALQGGATFEIRDAVTGALIKTVTDNGTNDVDGTAGRIKVANIALGTYNVIETVAPPGYARDDDFTRQVTVSIAEPTPVIGTQGVIDYGNTDESDFFNRLGSISWEKRREDNNYLQGGATFEIRVLSTGAVVRTVTDNGAGDDNPNLGQITVNNILLGTYLVVETIPPAGFALDDDPTRVVKVADDTDGIDDNNNGTPDDNEELNVVIGTQFQDDPGNTDESDFHNPPKLGSIAWEKRRADTNALQGGATFTVTNNATGAVITVTDNGPDDTDPDLGQFKVVNLPVGSYTVTETVAPTGFARDNDFTRSVTIALGALNQVIGTQNYIDPGDTDESDFFNRLGSISWEKRREDNNALQGGATFQIRDAFTGALIRTVTDNSTGDADPDPGQITVKNIPLGTYIVRETIAPAGYALDDDPTRLVRVAEDTDGIDDNGNGIIDDKEELCVVIGTQQQDDPGNLDESDFHNRLGSIAWEKRRADTLALQGGATFTIKNYFTGVIVRTVTDNGPGDVDPVAGRIKVVNLLLGTYVVTETIAPPGFAIDPHKSRIVKVSDDSNGIDDDGDGIVDDSEELNAVIGTQGAVDSGLNNEADFIDPIIDFSKKDFIL